MNIRRLLYILVATLITLIFSSCTSSTTNPTAEYLQNNPIPQPDFVIDTYSSTDHECIRISQEPFWVEGFNDGSFSRHIKENIVIKLNNQIVQNDNIIFSVDNMNTPIQDNAGNVIGSYGGTITFCIAIESISNGLHLINIMFTDLDTSEFSYSWSFRK